MIASQKVHSVFVLGFSKKIFYYDMTLAQNILRTCTSNQETVVNEIVFCLI